MRARLLFIIASVTFTSAFSQPAVDWTVPDCNSTSHHLFAELDSGKVIVLMWVMPCGLCIGPALTAYNVVQNSVASGCPVRYYLVDDYANTNCSTLTAWAQTNSIGPNITAFSNVAINMQDYGFPGMPKVVVLGRNDHFIYYNEDNAVNGTLLQNAVNQACNDVMNGVNGEQGTGNMLSVYPNPSANTTQIKFELPGSANIMFEIRNISGALMRDPTHGSFNAGINSSTIDITDLPEGIYTVGLISEPLSSYSRLIVIR